MSSTSPFWVLQSTRPTSTPSVWVSQRSTPWCPKSSKMPRQPQLFGREEMSRYFSEKWSWDVSGIPITFFNKSWGVSCYKKQVSNLVQHTYPHQGHHELPCVGSKKLRTIRPRGSLVLGSLENPSLHRKHKGSLDSFTGSKLGTSKNGVFFTVVFPTTVESWMCPVGSTAAEVPTSAPWGIAPSQVVSHWQSLGRRSLGF